MRKYKKSVTMLLAVSLILLFLFPTGILADDDSGLSEDEQAMTEATLMVVDEENNTITYISPEETDDVNIKVYEKFGDVSADDWYVSYLSHLVQLGLIHGLSEAEFAPYEYMTRGEFATILAYVANVDLTQYEGVSSFLDVPASAWYAPQVAWTYQSGLMQGREMDRFYPKSPITREEAAVLMYRYAKSEDSRIFKDNQYEFNEPSDIEKSNMTDEEIERMEAELAGPAYADEADISSWAAEKVDAMHVAGIFCGDEGNYFHPRYPLLRAECMKIFSAYIINDTKPTFYFPGGSYIEYLDSDDAEVENESFSFDSLACSIYLLPLYAITPAFPVALFLIPVFTIAIVLLSGKFFHKGLPDELWNGFFLAAMIFSLFAGIFYFICWAPWLVKDESVMLYAFGAGLFHILSLLSFICYLVQFMVRFFRRKQKGESVKVKQNKTGIRKLHDSD